MSIQGLLEKLGYHPHEANIYLAALELGEATISDLAHKTEIPRTTVSEVVEHMHKKGLLLSYARKKHTYWIAETPETILKHMKANEESFAEILPQLSALGKEPSHKPITRMYFGVSEIKSILDDMIETKHHIASLISMEDWFRTMGEDMTQDFIQRRYTHFLKMRMITPKTEQAQKLKKSDPEQLRLIKFLPSDIDLRRITNFIYGDKIAIISFNKKEPTGIVIEDADVAYGNLLYFENLWEHSSEN